MSHEEVHRQIVGPHDLFFDPQPVRSLLAERSTRQGSGAVGVLSSEILSGTMFGGARDSVSLANRLKAIAPSAKIVFTIRKQDKLLSSIYLQYVKRGGRKTFEKFIQYSPEPGFHWFDSSLLEFDRLILFYESLFGEGNVLVLPQELLRENRQAFLAYLFAFVDAEGDPTSLSYSGSRGASPPASGIPLMRLANAFRQTPLNPEGFQTFSPLANMMISIAYRYKLGKGASDRALASQVSSVATGQYGASNARIQQFVPVDLAAFGYELRD